MPKFLALVLLSVFAFTATACGETLSHGRFKQVHIYRPKGEVRHFVLLLSGDGGWSSGLASIAEHLADEGALVAGIDVAQFFENLDADGGSCVFPDGDLENLSHYIQAYYKVPTYYTPVLMGHSAGASLAYAVLAQAPPGTFAGAVTLSFCADLDLRKPLCKSGDLDYKPLRMGSRLLPPRRLPGPWTNLHGLQDDVCPASEAREFVSHTPGARFVGLPGTGHNYGHPSTWMPQLDAAYASVTAAQTHTLPLPPQSLADLPIIEVPAEASRSVSNTFAVLLSGDGGWAGIDKEIASVLASRGIPVAGLDSLRYFWTARTPEGVSHDVDRIIRYYASHWKTGRVLLIGYSQGADVLPFAVNRLPRETRALVALTALIGISQSAEFEFHVANWIGAGEDGRPTAPEMARLSAADTLCLYGDDDEDSICPKLKPTNARVVELSGGHHFGGDYARVAEVILQAAAHSRPAGPAQAAITAPAAVGAPTQAAANARR